MPPDASTPPPDPGYDTNDEPLLVACLCAGWCGTCRDYRPAMEQVLAGFGAQVTMCWVDIEDDDEVVGDFDVQDFPTLLLARAGQPLFLGPLTPQPQTLDRLVRSALADERPVLPDRAAHALAASVRAHARHGDAP